MTFVGAIFIWVRDDIRDTKGTGVERCLWYETIGKWDAKKTGNPGRKTQQENVPVKASWFPQREFGALGYEGGNCL